MFKLLVAVTLLASVSCFKFQLNAQSYCVSSDLQYCHGLVSPCTGVLVAVPQPRNLTVYLCVKLTGVVDADIGTYNRFTLVDPFDHYVCSYKSTNSTYGNIGWGARSVSLVIIARGFNTMPSQPPAVCRGGSLLKIPSVSNVVYACIHLQGWAWEDIFRSYSMQPTPNCSLEVHLLTEQPKHYYPTQQGVIARPIRDEL
ncbi:hypothetical protein [Bat coronavirus HKU9-3]|uniref:Uncharacterized protein NS7a n=2 Tax=Bat coronavirus HKU9 TaxID=694006 RepID=A3EXI7_BCHK9|nr:hypothetical protein [Bat coronavirus HKU9-3]ADM33563.1 hypothetical protein [Bat coronavirus HKU9-5-1]